MTEQSKSRNSSAKLLRDIEKYLQPRDDGNYHKGWEVIERMKKHLSSVALSERGRSYDDGLEAAAELCGHAGGDMGRTVGPLLATRIRSMKGQSTPTAPATAWLIERADGSRELVFSPLTDDTPMDEGDEATPLFERNGQ